MPANRTGPGKAAGIALLLALAALAGACRRQERPSAAGGGAGNLLLITLDTTRADRIGAYGDGRAATPNLDRLAREGVRFDRAYTSVPLTLPAHVTLMTGCEPPAHQVRNNGTYSLRPEATTLAEVFQQAGFSTMAMVASFVLEKKYGLAQGFDGYDDALDAPKADRYSRPEIPASRVYDKFSRWLAGSPSSPFFCWIHFYDPHAPYQPPAPYAARFADDPYRGEIACMDEAIGRMLQDLDRRGLLADTLVVVAGDHGEGFGEHGEYEHGVFCYEEMLRVPLIFRQPRLFPGGKAVSRPVGLVDVLPTLLELYRLPAPGALQGSSFARLLSGGQERGAPAPAYYFESMNGMEEMGWAPLTGLRRGDLKFIRLPHPELYDLAVDPLEKDNLYLKKNVLAKGLARELDEFLDKTAPAKNQALRPLPSRQDQARLRALGYIAASDPAPRTAGGEDPKDEIATLTRLRLARQAIHSGDLAGAERQIAAMQAAGSDRRYPQFFDMRFELAEARKDPAASAAALRAAIARFPDLSRFALLLAAHHRAHGDERQTEEAAQLALARDPDSFEAHLLLAELYRNRRLTAKAIAHFEKAMALQPGDPGLAIALADMHLESGQPDRSLAVLRPLLDRGADAAPLAADIRGQAAKLLVRLGQPELAEGLLRELVREQGSDPAHWTQLGLAQLDRGQGDEAVRSFQQALSLDPGCALALSGLGTLHLTLFRQRHDRQSLRLAEEYFSRALKTDSRLVTAENGLGIVYLYQGDAPRAIERLLAATRLDPNFVNAHFNLAIAQLSSGRKAEARRTLSRIQERLAGRLSAAERSQLAALSREAGS